MESQAMEIEAVHVRYESANYIPTICKWLIVSVPCLRQLAPLPVPFYRFPVQSMAQHLISRWAQPEIALRHPQMVRMKSRQRLPIELNCIAIVVVVCRLR